MGPFLNEIHFDINTLWGLFQESSLPGSAETLELFFTAREGICFFSGCLPHVEQTKGLYFRS